MTPAVVTTKHRGVFFGNLSNGVPEQLGGGESIAISDIRMCIYWPASLKGILGLASKGPNSGCKISDKVPGETRLYGVTAVIPVTDAVAKKWEEAPWS